MIKEGKFQPIDFIKQIESKKQALRNEITIIELSSQRNNLKITDFEEKKFFELRAKLNIIEEILESIKDLKMENLFKEQLDIDRYVVKYESLDGLVFGHAGIKENTTTIFYNKPDCKNWIDENRKDDFIYMIIEIY